MHSRSLSFVLSHKHLHLYNTDVGVFWPVAMLCKAVRPPLKLSRGTIHHSERVSKGEGTTSTLSLAKTASR
jgi:hypothetical protein